MEYIFKRLSLLSAKIISLAQLMNHYHTRLNYYKAIWKERLNLRWGQLAFRLHGGKQRFLQIYASLFHTKDDRKKGIQKPIFVCRTAKVLSSIKGYRSGLTKKIKRILKNQYSMLEINKYNILRVCLVCDVMQQEVRILFDKYFFMQLMRLQICILQGKITD